MNTKTAIWVLVAALIVIVLFVLLRGPAEAPTEESGGFMTEEDSMMEDNVMEEDAMEEDGVMMEENENIVLYTDSGYSPGEVRISVGETVTWRNESSLRMWTASAIHPTHMVYPGSDIRKCGNSEAIFDACTGISPGGEWSFTFSEAGSWGYHNHVRASHTGRVIVE